MTPETIGITITYREPVTFHLRMISLDEEDSYRQKMFGLTADERKEKTYQNNIDMLADLSEKHPDVTETDEEGNVRTLPYEFQNSIRATVRAYFAEKTIIKERIAEYAVRAYFAKLVPDVFFVR